MEIIQGTPEIYDEIVGFVTRYQDDVFVKKGFNKYDNMVFNRILHGRVEQFFTVRYAILLKPTGTFQSGELVTVVSYKDIDILFPKETMESLKDVLLKRERIQNLSNIDIFRSLLKKPIL